MIVHYSPQVLKDLCIVKWSIDSTNQDGKSSLDTVQEILKNCEQLKNHPLTGISLSKKIKMPSDYNFILCQEWLIFYKKTSEDIYIERIINYHNRYLKTILDI